VFPHFLKLISGRGKQCCGSTSQLTKRGGTQKTARLPLQAWKAHQVDHAHEGTEGATAHLQAETSTLLETGIFEETSAAEKRQKQLHVDT
jgi:hypothetical protein